MGVDVSSVGLGLVRGGWGGPWRGLGEFQGGPRGEICRGSLRD